MCGFDSHSRYHGILKYRGTDTFRTVFLLFFISYSPMADITLSADTRDASAKIQETRDEGRVPGVVYGHHFESLPISVEYQEFRKAYRVAGDSTLISLNIDGKTVPTLVHDVQYDPVLDTFLHIDFYAVKENEAVKTHVPLVFVGTAPAVKNLAGVLTTALDAIEIKCLPKYLVHDIEVDVSGIEDFHTTITVGDLEIAKDKNIEIITDLESSVASVTPPKGADDENEEESSESGDAKDEDKKDS